MKECGSGGSVVRALWVEESRFCAQGCALQGGSVQSLISKCSKLPCTF